jgi:uncharacterized protein DUF4389
MDSDYPVRFTVDYPDRDLDRLSSALRIFWIIPIAIVLGVVAGGGIGGQFNDKGAEIAGAGGILFAGPLLMILFRKKYPRWWFDWNLELTRFGTRVGVYFALMNDEYPSTDDEQTVHVDIDYPDVENDLQRGMPLIKWLLAIPHYIILFVLAIAAFFALIGAWFAVVFTGRYPRGIFDFLVGFHRWALRVEGYAFLLVTDRYPPFSLDP